MSLLLIIAFLLACALGALVAWHVTPSNRLSLSAMAIILSASTVAGAVIVAAEAGSAAVRYLGLTAVLLGSAALFAAFMAAWRVGRTSGPSARR